MKLGIDVDGVLAIFNDSFARLLKKLGGPDFPKSSAEWPTTWNWEADVSGEIKKAAWDEVTAVGSTFWHDLAPQANTATDLTALNGLAKSGHELFFLTNRLGYNASLQTSKWLYEYGIDYPNVILVSNKVPLIRTLGIDFFIDDRPETIWDLATAAKEQNLSCRGRIFLFEKPYNREQRHKETTAVGAIIEALQIVGLVAKEEAA